MFRERNDLIQYVCDSYPEVTDQRIDSDHWDLLCPVCKLGPVLVTVKSPTRRT